MIFATTSPAVTTGGPGNPPVCQNCTTSTTPLWRRDEMGSVLCNACGLFLKLHGTSRPISLKTDVIKSRNRVKTAGQGQGQGQKRKSMFDGNDLSVSRSDADIPPPGALNHKRVSQKTSSGDSDRSNSPMLRTQTPALHLPSNIAPQHMFDGVSLAEHDYQSPALPHLRHHSPGSTSPFADRNLELPQTYEGLLQVNTALKTRVSELEVINDLLRGTFHQYEQNGAPQAEMVPRNSDEQLRHLLEQSQRREQELKQKVEELEHEVEDLRGEQSVSKSAPPSAETEYPEPPQLSITNGIHG